MLVPDLPKASVLDQMVFVQKSSSLFVQDLNLALITIFFYLKHRES